MRGNTFPRATAIVLALAVAGILATTALARSSAVPTVTAVPTLQGQSTQPFVGDKLSTTNGTWTGSPTKYAYEWDRCDPTGDRVNCVAISGATAQSYTVVTADINHTLRAIVSATNADGTGKSDTKGSGVVAARTSPKNTARPTITGTPPVVGNTLTAENGTWTGAATFSYQWQQCDANGNNCADISGATGKTYGVRSTDQGRELLVSVKVSNRFGSTTADSDRTVPVTTVVQTTTTVVTVKGNQPPTITFISLKHVGNKLYARFRTCDDSQGAVKVTERDSKARALAYTRHFKVACGTYARNWLVLKRFRSAGRLVVTLRASDSAGKLSRLVSRSVVIH